MNTLVLVFALALMLTFGSVVEGSRYSQGHYGGGWGGKGSGHYRKYKRSAVGYGGKFGGGHGGFVGHGGLGGYGGFGGHGGFGKGFPKYG